MDCAYQQNGGHSRQFASARVYAYKKFVTEISQSETSGTMYNPATGRIFKNETCIGLALENSVVSKELREPMNSQVLFLKIRPVAG